jgi:hypothetical protein
VKAAPPSGGKQTVNEQSVALYELSPTGNEQWLAIDEQRPLRVGVCRVTN